MPRLDASFARASAGTLSVVLVLAGCSGPTDVADNDALMRTSAHSYSLVTRDDRVDVEIPFTFDNRTGGDVYLQTCTIALPPVLERKDGDDWHTAWTSPSNLACGTDPIRLSPGTAYADTLYLFAFLLGDDRQPQFQNLNVAGTYRLRWDRALSSYDSQQVPAGDPIELRYRVSNEFQLTGEYKAAPPEQPKLTHLIVNVSRNPIAVGDTAKLTVTGLDQSYKPIAVTDPINWSQAGVWDGIHPSGWGVVDVLSGGTVIGVRAGKLIVNASVGLATGQTPLEVVPR